MSQPFDDNLFLSSVRARGLRFGQPFHYFEETTSSNDEALIAAKEGAPHGALFVAERQSQGRGRRGRSWFSAPAESLTFSLLVRPTIRQENAAALSLVVGLAVRDALIGHIEPKRGTLGIKWPNDIVCQRKKLAGILIEMSQSPSGAGPNPAIVIGVGINLGAQNFPEEIQALATSLALLTNLPLPKREDLLVDLLSALDERIESFTTHGLERCLAELELADALRGHRVRIDDLTGVASGISARGELLVEYQGKVQRIASGTVLYDDTVP